MNAACPSTALSSIREKVVAGSRLTFEDGLALYASRDIHEIGRLADSVRRRKHGDLAYYNVNRHINYTNYCVLRCRFCSFFRPYFRDGSRFRDIAKDEQTPPIGPSGGRLVAVPNDRAAVVGLRQPARSACDAHDAPAGASALPNRDACGLSNEPDTETAQDARGISNKQIGDWAGDAYERSIEQIVELAREAYAAGATEVHIVGGLHPRLPFSYYTEMCRAIRTTCPRIHIKAFTAIEIIHLTRIARPRRTIRQVLEQLREAGLSSLPGGGAEIFDERVHREAYKNKVGEAGWFDVHRVAHELGIPTNATMLYGHVETPAERIAHMLKLREHQDESLRSRAAAFNCFVPLPFVPDGSALSHLPGPTGLDDLKTLAISRLMLDNVPHIKAFWIMLSAKLAQVSLSWGVDDVDGTVVFYDITKKSRSREARHQELSVEQIQRLIREAGFEPVERDSLYRRVERRDGDAGSS